MNDINITPEMLAYVPLIAAILQMLKKVPNFEKIKPYAPFMAIIAAFLILYAQNQQAQIIESITLGLMASGAYSGYKGISSNGGK